MTKRLIVDDIRDLPIEAVTVRTAQEAIDRIATEDWDEIWLDFDLGGKPYETDDQLTIMPLVNVLEQMEWDDPSRKPVIYVHTMNPVGRRRIRDALDRGYVVVDVMLYSRPLS